MKRYKSSVQTIMLCSLNAQFFFSRICKIASHLSFRKKNNNPFFFPVFSLLVFNQDVSLMQETRNQTGNLFRTERGIRLFKPQKDARLGTNRNQFEGSISEEYAFRSSGLGHRKLSGLSSLSGGIRRRLSRYMWSFSNRILEFTSLVNCYLKIFPINFIKILSIVNII